jgi:site-specific DNA-cytosine methylase
MSDASCPLVLSLFPGIGLLDMAFEEEGFCVVRGPDVLWGGDVRRFHPPPGRFCGVIGGPPCQSFSPLANLVRACGREPKFGNLIPEFARVVGEARPAWWLMENVAAAPVPVVADYGAASFLLDNCWLPGDGGDGFGQEQMRLRRFTFGRLGRAAENLRRYIDVAVFLLPESSAAGALTQYTPANSPEAKRRTRTVTALGPDHLTGLAESTERVRRERHEAVTGGNDRPPSIRDRDARKQLTPAVCAMEGSDSRRPETDRVRARRYTLAEACRLQGLPEDFLDDAPFTAAAKLKAVANGVPLPMGRAVARAVREAIHSHSQEATR